ncbi:uncharacterized protein Dmoj_GI13502, isoform D [Drosophila mojavensis]|uniref:Uncharacterized protein, isoform D n=1 Tax=Drosophila mojavensis TaxID=7230 RepID=A0A0Q9XPM1_DROMO|nr:uncharacterized protein Dmoj_GI13502, isoform D [Drosophila mojavensis]
MARWWPFVSLLLVCYAAAQDDNIDVERECTDRPADEYFRLSTDGDCREVYRCDNGREDGSKRLAPIRCASSLSFDVERQLCDWRSNVKNCDVKENVLSRA